MHDPLVVAYEIRTPIPEVRVRRPAPGKPQGPRWSAFWYIGEHELYFPPVVTIWHREPGDADAFEVCPRNGNWKHHVAHWQVQLHPVQKWRRRIMTRCAECRGKSTKKNPVNCSLQWDSPEVPWWYPEQELYHHACSAKVSARKRDQHQARERLARWDQYRAQIAALQSAAADLQSVGEPEAAGYLLLEVTRIRMNLEQETEEVREDSRARAKAREAARG